MVNLFQQIVGLEQKDVPCAFADENLIIQANNMAMNHWVELNVESLVGYFLPDAFPELVGLDRYLSRLLHNPNEVFTIAMINRVSHTGRENYFDLTVQAVEDGEKGLLLSVSDVTEQTHLAREQQQQDNERYLRSRKGS